MSGTITGRTLAAWGHRPGPWWRPAMAAAEAVRAGGGDEGAQRAAVDRHAPAPAIPLRSPGALAYHLNIAPEGDGEAENIANVERHMAELMRVPTIRAGAVMPDACPSGAAPGTIPVGGVVAAENAIHPGMHSADICCSMAVTVFKGSPDPTAILDAGMGLSHFGGGGRREGTRVQPPADVTAAFDANPFLKPFAPDAVAHFATQGDGNHFFYVGRVASTGAVALVTHHGSRAPGARLHGAGMAVAERTRQRLSPETGKHNAWIVADSREGEDYWRALQVVRAWTKANHYAIHDRVMAALGLAGDDRYWNEHNFVFRKSDGLFYHAKGATPAFPGFADDSDGRTLIPLNMAEPVLIARGMNAPNGLGFAPHGAGRNLSRTAYMRQHAGRTEAAMMAEQTVGIDARFYCGVPDVSELPGAYKSAGAVRRQIVDYGLADVVDVIEPIGSIMAGDWQRDAPWRKAKDARAAGGAGRECAP